MERKRNKTWHQVIGFCLLGVLSIGVGCSDANSPKANRPQAKQPDASKPDAKPSDTTTKSTPADSGTTQNQDRVQKEMSAALNQPTNKTANAIPDAVSVAETVTAVTPRKPAQGTTVNPNITPLGRTTPSLPSGEIPKVLLTDQHAALCFVKTSDQMPEMELPDLSGENTSLSSLYGEKLTVVCFWKGDRAFAREELAELTPDVANTYSGQGVNVIGVAVEETPESAAGYAKEAGSVFPVLVDADGQAFSQVGNQKLPRTYLLDANGKILWFDIEYSRSTRRELQAAIRSIVGAG